MSILSTRTHWAHRHAPALAAATVGLSLLAGTARPDAQSTTARIVSPKLTGAKTVRVTEKVFYPDKPDHGALERTLNVKIERASGIRIEQTMLHDYSGGGEMPGSSVFILNDKTHFEYCGPINQYCLSAAPASGQEPVSTLVFAYHWAADLDLLLQGQYEANSPDTQVTLTTESLEGKRMQLTTIIFPAYKQADGSLRQVTTKHWTDLQTGLPFRVALYVTSGGQKKQINYIDFSNWVLDEPIPPSQFDCTPPAGATAYVAPTPLTPGTPAPDFEVITPEGKRVHLSDYMGKTVILDFWATWCPPCQHSLMHLQKVFAQVKDRDVAVLAICIWDEKNAYRKWVADKKGTYTFGTVFDPAGTQRTKSVVARLYGVYGIPVQYVISKEGRIAAFIGGFDPSDHRLEATLNMLGIPVPQEDGSSSRE